MTSQPRGSETRAGDNGKGPAPHVFWSFLLERSIQHEAVQAVLDVAMTCGAAGYTRMGIPYARTDMARNTLANAFLEASDNPNDTLVMLDCDHLHPPDIVPRLAVRQEGVVAGLAFRRSPPHEPLWFVKQPDGILRAPAEFEPVVYECDFVAPCAMAVKRWVFQKLADLGHKHFFKYVYYPDGGSNAEDWGFSEICMAAGIKHHVDCSLIIPHIASRAIDLETWEAYRAAHPEIVSPALQGDVNPALREEVTL